MAILLLQERGKLRVRDPVCLYISGCGKTWMAITLQNLLTHTSGIPDYGGSLSRSQRSPSESLLQYLERQPLDFRPGSQFRHSSSGYAILGSVIQRLSGDPYVGFLRREIFNPLHLTDTGDLQSSPSVANLAIGYGQAWTAAAPWDTSPLFATGSLYSTVENLYAWDAALFGQTFATERTREEMLTPHVTECNSAGVLCRVSECNAQKINCLSYGYGLFLQQLPIRDGYVHVIGHNGLVPGFSSLNYYNPEQKLTVIVLSNIDTFSSNAILALSCETASASPPPGPIA